MAGTIKAYKCPECSAPLKVAAEETQARCQYCGNSFAVQHTRKPPPPTQTHTVWAPPPTSRWLVMLPFMFTMTIVGVSLWRAGIFSMLPALSSLAGSGPGSGGFSPAGERLQWDSLSPIVIAAVDDDGMEDVIGRYRTLDGSDQSLWIGAFSGADFHRLWKAGPFGTLTTAMQAVHLAVIGDRVLVTDGRNTARLFELKTGAPSGVIPLSDRADQVCAHEGSFFINSVDGRGLLVSARTGAATEKKRPSWCARARNIGDHCYSMHVHLHSECRDGGAPSHAGFRARWVLREGARAVAVGGKHPGTQLPMLMGYDAESRRVDWVRPLGADATLVADGAAELTELAGGRVFSYYNLKTKGGRVARLDAKTGEVRWDVVLPRSESGTGPSELVATERRVYLPHWTWLDVLDANSGAHLGTIGRW